MVPFFSLVGSAIRRGRSRVAYDALVSCGFSPRRAWFLVDGWALVASVELETGWTPEATAIEWAVGEVAGWRGVPWSSLISGTLAGARSGPSR